jgi:outer membrane cobalamin receptor
MPVHPGASRVTVRPLIGYAILAVALGGIAFAQEEPAEEASGDELQEVVVTASRVERSAASEPVSVHVIDAEELEHAGTLTLGDALRWVPGIDISGGAAFGAASRTTALLLGLPAQYSLILVDGQRTKSDHIHTGVNLELIPVSSIERIEVVRGPGSVVHGSGALGGVVNVITKPVPEEPTTVLLATYGSEDTFDVGVLNGMRRGSFGYAIMADATSSDGIVTDHYYDRRSARLKLLAAPSEEFRATFDASYYDGEYGPPEKWSADTTASCLLDVESTATGAGRLKGTFGYTDYDRVFNSGERTADNDVASTVLQYDRDVGGANHVIAGFEWRGEEFRRHGTPASEIDIASGYVQDAVLWGESLKLLAGVRVDDSDATGTDFSPRGALYWSSGPNEARLSVAKGLRMHSLQDLYEEKYDHSSYYRDGNPDLEPETAVHVSVEARCDLLDSRLKLSAFLFRNDITDMIALRDTGTTYLGLPVQQRANIKEAHTQGVEVGVSGRIEGLQTLTWQLSYGFLDAEDDTTGQQLAYNPEHTVKAGLSYRVGRFSFDVLAQAVADRYYRDKSDAVLPLDDYFLLDVNVAMLVTEKLSISLSVKNALDDEFETYEEGKSASAYGRFAAFGLKAEF